jgi:hypothetical protein
MRTILKVMLGLLLGVVVLVVGCAVLLGSAADEVDQQLRDEQEANAVTDTEARALKLGTRRRAVIEQLGRPESTQESENEGLGRSGCIYYNRSGGDVGETWQFCFENGRLRGKNRL